MENINDYKQLRVWRKSMDLVKDVYVKTKGFPKEEVYGLTAQMRRSAVSIPSNIAEGFRRRHAGDKRQFLRIVSGSLAELETQLLISCELGFLTREDMEQFSEKLDHIGRMITLMNKAISSDHIAESLGRYDIPNSTFDIR